MRKGSRTGAGQAEAGRSDGEQTTPEGDANDLIDTINQIFSLFSINYHNQYFNAFKDENTEVQAKKFWLESLKTFAGNTLLLAAQKSIRESSYLPTIHQMIRYCRHIEGNCFPDCHAAYREACNATSPKRNYRWSHPVVYFAGRNCNWHFLASNSEATAYPVFKGHYEALCEQLVQGLELPAIEPLALPENSEVFLTKEENIERLATLRECTGI